MQTLPVSDQEDKKSFIQILQKTHPETIALADEFDDLARSIAKVETRFSKCVSYIIDNSPNLYSISSD